MSISFHLKKGLHSFCIDVELSFGDELAVLFGPSGSGKTSILNMLAGIVRPDEGFVTIDGKDVFNSERGISIPIRGRRIGYLFQEYALFPHMTVFENIAYGIDHLPKREVKVKVEKFLELMRLGGLEGRYPHELSGGQRQRVALARTMAVEPEVLLLDEPFSALDQPVREKLRNDLLMIHERYPITTLFVTHDLEEAFIMGERIAILNEGRLEQVGTKEEVFYRPRTRNVARFLGARNIFSGRVISLNGREALIENPELGVIKALVDPEVSIDQMVSFGIRPEEVMVIRRDRPLDRTVQDNLLEGEITGLVGKGANHTVYFKVKDKDIALKIEVPNFAFRKLKLSTGMNITVSLKRESIWVIPEK